jgi:acetyl-CoA/propionyl-CoA carboxylase biotin carboxyl carrier protein
VRVDGGYDQGETIPGSFDSLVAKLIVTGATREQALQRSARALSEFVVDGMPTVIPFHRAVTADPAFTDAPFRIHTRWIETEFDNTIEPFVATDELPEPDERQNVVVEVGGRRLEVSLPGGFAVGTGAPKAATAKPRKRAGGKTTAVSGDAVAAPMQGTIVKIAVEDGQTVAAGDLIVVLEAMKMENPVTAHKAGTVFGLTVAQGETVTQGSVLCELKD